MYKNEFDKNFNNNIIYNAYMFYGASEYLVQSYSSKVANSLGDEVTKVYFDEYDFNYCYDTLSQSSLFSSSNILLIKTLKRIPKKDVDRLIDACRVNSDSKVIFCCIGDANFKDMAKSFTSKTSSVEVRFYPPYDNEAINILAAEAKANNLNIDHQTLAFLYNMHQKDISLCVGDISKLSILQGEIITSKTINQHCFGLGAVDIEEFLVNLFNGVNINKDLYYLLEEGINAIQLLNRITTFAQTLFMINSYLKLYGELNIREIWGYPLPKQIAQTQAQIATKYKQDDFVYMLNFLQELELELKSSKISDIDIYLQSKLRIFLNKSSY